MTREQMQCFFNVVELGSFTAAADAMYMTQPSLSKRIKALEEELGIVLFTRDKSKPTELSKAGRVFYEGTRHLDEELGRVIEAAKNAENGVIGTIRLGVFESQMIDDQLQSLLNGFTEEYPEVELFITTNNFDGLVEDVQAGKLDCAVTVGADVIGRTQLQHRFLYHLKTCLVVPKKFLSDEWKNYRLEDFKDYPFLTIDPADNRFQDKMLRRDMEKAGFEPTLIRAMDERNFMMQLEMGKGIAILDVFSKGCYSPNVQTIMVPEIEPTAFDLVWSDKNRNPVFQCLLEYIDKWKKSN